MKGLFASGMSTRSARRLRPSRSDAAGFPAGFGGAVLPAWRGRAVLIGGSGCSHSGTGCGGRLPGTKASTEPGASSAARIAQFGLALRAGEAVRGRAQGEQGFDQPAVARREAGQGRKRGGGRRLVAHDPRRIRCDCRARPARSATGTGRDSVHAAERPRARPAGRAWHRRARPVRPSRRCRRCAPASCAAHRARWRNRRAGSGRCRRPGRGRTPASCARSGRARPAPPGNRGMPRG